MCNLTEIHLKNFKCFEKLDLELSSLNVLSGINNMGKSTIIQALLLLRQSFEMASLSSGLHLNGSLVTIGTGRDLLYRKSDTDIVSIALCYGEKCYSWDYAYEKDSNFLKLSSEKQEMSNQNELLPNLFAKDFSYTCADRLGPQRVYEKAYYEVVEKHQIGMRGEQFADFLDEFGQSYTVMEPLRHPKAKDGSLIYQMQAWLSEISPGITLNTQSYPEAGLVGMLYSSENFTPQNVGFGLSYVAPIVLNILKAKPGNLLIMENPEAHLHPSGQRKIGELIALACAGGVQIILETHSDHILNGIRLSVKRGKINRRDIRLNYFYLDTDENGELHHRKCSPQILDDGSLSAWPDGFFDEWDKAIDALF